MYHWLALNKASCIKASILWVMVYQSKIKGINMSMSQENGRAPQMTLIIEMVDLSALIFVTRLQQGLKCLVVLVVDIQKRSL